MSEIEFVLAVLAAYRIGRAIAIDTVFEQLRSVLGRVAGPSYSPGWYVAELFHCQLCIGFWASMAASAFIGGSITEIIFHGLAIAGAQCALALWLGGRE